MKNGEEPIATKRYQVFLSYASADKETAHKIAKKLSERGIRVFLDTYELQPGDSIAKAITVAISASDYLVVILSPSAVNSAWVQNELAAAFSRELTARAITLLPVLIADCEIPPSLASYQFLDLRKDFDEGVNRLVEQIGLIPRIDFSLLDHKGFGNLIVDLLAKLGFGSLVREPGTAEIGVDIEAEYPTVDPFGVETTEIWLVEVKFYSQSRADLASLRQLVDYMQGLSPRNKGLLVTNGQLTSAARDWLASAEAQYRMRIRVIDGAELRRLLLQHKDLVDKYFGKKAERHDDQA